MGKLSKDDIIASLKEMTLLEVHDLIKAIEETFDVSASAPVAVAAGGGDAGADAQSEFNVLVTAVGDKKVNLIKVIKAELNIGLLDAKKMVDGATPITVKEQVAKEEADSLKGKLEEAGATVELK